MQELAFYLASHTQQANGTLSKEILKISDWHVFEFSAVMLHYVSFWKETRAKRESGTAGVTMNSYLNRIC